MFPIMRKRSRRKIKLKGSSAMNPKTYQCRAIRKLIMLSLVRTYPMVYHNGRNQNERMMTTLFSAFGCFSESQT